MNRHLAPHEFVDALEGRIDGAPGAHLRGCASCRERLAGLSALVERLQPGGNVPAPSPLFWETFSGRVRRATAAGPATGVAWRVFWRPAVVLAGVTAVAVLFVIGSRPAPLPDVQTVPGRSEAMLQPLPVPDAVPDVVDGSNVARGVSAVPRWDSVVKAASELSWEDVRTSTLTQPGTADLAIAGLSSTERLRLARLLQSDLGGTR